MQMGTYQLYSVLGRPSEKHDGKYKVMVRRMTQNQPPLSLFQAKLKPLVKSELSRNSQVVRGRVIPLHEER